MLLSLCPSFSWFLSSLLPLSTIHSHPTHGSICSALVLEKRSRHWPLSFPAFPQLSPFPPSLPLSYISGGNKFSVPEKKKIKKRACDFTRRSNTKQGYGDAGSNGEQNMLCKKVISVFLQKQVDEQSKQRSSRTSHEFISVLL